MNDIKQLQRVLDSVLNSIPNAGERALAQQAFNNATTQAQREQVVLTVTKHVIRLRLIASLERLSKQEDAVA